MRGFKSIFVSSKHKINCFLIQEKYFQTANAVDTLPLIGALGTHAAFGTVFAHENTDPENTVCSENTDPGYMSRKIRMFRTGKFDARNKLKF